MLKSNSHSYFSILENLHEIIWVCSLDTTCVYINKKGRQVFGIDQLNSNPMQSSLFHPNDYDALVESFAFRFLEQKFFEEKARLSVADGQFRWHHLRFNPIDEEEDHFWIVQAVEIEDQSVAIDELERSKLLQEFVLENSPEIIMINNYLTHKVVYSNKVIEKVLGFSNDYMDSLGDKFFAKHIHPGDLQKVQQWLANVGKKGLEEDRKLLHRIKDAKGKWHWMALKSVVFSRTDDGQVKEILNYLQDVSPLKETEERLQNSLNMIKQMAQTSPDLILIYDYHVKKVIYSNRVYSCFGYSVDVLKSHDDKMMKQIVLKDDWYIFKDFSISCEITTGNSVKEIEYRLIDTNGDACWIRERARTFRLDESGRVKQVIFIIQDITEKKKVEESSRENELLNKLLEKKDEFMSVASHELKTPITTMKASIQIMKRLIEKHTDQKTLLVFLGKANQQINKLTSLISDLMDNAKIQAGKMTIHKASFSIAELVEDCIAHISDEHTITVKSLVDVDLYGDRIRIEQVLVNFLSNAVKYSPGGKEIILEVSLAKDEIKFSVTDFGIGIPEEKMAHLFDRFYRVDNKSQEFSGLGLGLYISAEIIKQHDGRYGVSSKVGEGSTFWFSIPFKGKDNTA